MIRKSFKIGECAVGGILEIEIRGTYVTINALDYNTKKQVVAPLSVSIYGDNYLHNLECYLLDLTTSYYADKIMTWIKKQVNL